MQKHIDLVDLVKSFPTNIVLQILASIEKRTSPIKFDHLAEKSESALRYRILQLSDGLRVVGGVQDGQRPPVLRAVAVVDHLGSPIGIRTRMNNIE